jgi:hypothetical protein
MSEILNRLQIAIEKYRKNQYNEEDFQSTLNSVIEFITEYDLLELRNFLTSTDSDLELINYMVEKEDRRDEYLKVINKIERFTDDFFSL